MSTLTLNGLLRAIEEVERKIGPEPFKVFMLKQGCNPDEGWVLYLPMQYKQNHEGSLPTYVFFHPLAKDAICVNTSTFKLPNAI
jgi:hypothetical protein